MRKALDMDEAEMLKFIQSQGIKVYRYPGDKLLYFPNLPEASAKQIKRSWPESKDAVGSYASSFLGGPYITLRKWADRSTLIHEFLHHLFFLSLKDSKRDHNSKVDVVFKKVDALKAKCDKSESSEDCGKYLENYFEVFENLRQGSVERNFEEASIELLLFQYSVRGNHKIEPSIRYGTETVIRASDSAKKDGEILQNLMESYYEAGYTSKEVHKKLLIRLTDFLEENVLIAKEGQKIVREFKLIEAERAKKKKSARL